MADSSVPITAGTGTNIDSRTAGNGDHRQVVVLGNDGDVVVGLEPFGALQVNNGAQTLFYDAWDVSPIDTVDKWTVTGTSPTIANGNMTMSATASTYNAIRTKDTIRANVGFTLVRNGIALEATAATGAGRFWGLGTPATTPAAAVLVQDGIGFEVDQAAGTLLAVTYVAGVRTTVATLTRPTDGLNHAYSLHFRVTQAYWFIDNTQVPVASVSFPNVQMAQLPALLVRQNAATFTGTPVFTNIAHLTADTSRQGTIISDPVIGTRQARVGADGTVKVSGTGTAGVSATAVQTVQGIAGGTALPVSLATNTPDVTDRAARLLGVLSTGANTIGAVNIAAGQTVAVTQATAANLNTTAVLAVGTNAVGTVGLTGNGTNVTVRASAALTATATSATQTTPTGVRGVVIITNVTAVSGTTPTLTTALQYLDPASATWVSVSAATAAVSAAGLSTIFVYPGVTTAPPGTGSLAVNAPLPSSWRLLWTVTGTLPSFTFSVGATYVA